MMSCTVRRKVKGRAKVEVSTASATTVEVRSFGQVLSCKRWKSKRNRERRETAKVGMTAKVGQSERDGRKVKVGTRQVKVGNNKDQQE